MKNIKFAALGIALAFASPVAAADLGPTYKAAPVVAAYNWTGFYLGANAGWATSQNCWDFNPGTGVVAEGCHDAHGFIAGGQLGYRIQSGNWVLGVEAQGDWASMRGENPSNRIVGVPVADRYSNRTKVNGLGLFTGQIGYNMNTLLLYVKGGGAISWNTYEGFNTNNLVTFDRGDGVRGGATAGIGFEYALTQNWSAGIEYNHLFLAKKDYTRNAPFATGQGTISGDADMVTMRVNYRFGGPAPAVAARY